MFSTVFSCSDYEEDDTKTAGFGVSKKKSLTYCEVLGIICCELHSIEEGKAMNIKKELAGAATSMIILSVLAREPNYGYEIVKRANKSSGDLFTWQEGTIYPVLRKLEKEGLLTSDWQETGTGRQRKYYFITTAGRKALSCGRKEWEGFYTLITNTMEVSNAF